MELAAWVQIQDKAVYVSLCAMEKQGRPHINMLYCNIIVSDFKL